MKASGTGLVLHLSPSPSSAVDLLPLSRPAAAAVLGRDVLAAGPIAQLADDLAAKDGSPLIRISAFNTPCADSGSGKMLQVVKVFVAAGGLLQFAQPAQGNKSQVVKLDAVGKDVGYRHIRKAGDVVV